MKTISISQWVAAAVNRVAAARQSAALLFRTHVIRLSAERRCAKLKTAFAIALFVLFTSLPTFAQVTRTLGTLPPGGTVTITFDVTINTPFPANTASVTNQGNVTGTGIATILTDDPALGGASDPTVTAVTVAPQITCPSDLSTNGNGACPQSVAFNATVTAGVPAPTVIYKLGATPITSPYVFPIGTNTVTVTATNGTLPDATCSFKVTVVAGTAPQLSIVRSGTNVVVSWTNAFGCYALQTAPVLSSNSWSLYPGPFTTNGGKIYVTNGVAITNRFYRLSF